MTSWTLFGVLSTEKQNQTIRTDTCMSGTDLRTPMFIPALSTTARRWKRPKCPRTNEQINTSGPSRHWNSALTRKDVPTLATTWVNLQDAMLSERSQAQKDKHCVIPVIGSPKRSQIHRDSEIDDESQGQGQGECRMGAEFLWGKYESSGGGPWRWVHGHVHVFNATELHITNG